MLFVGTSIIHPSTEGVFLLCNILDLLIYSIVIDYSSRVVFYRNAEINFTKKEFDIIEFLSQNKGIIFDRETIYEKVWGLDGSGDNSVITEHIRRIRTKFLSIGDNPYIETVWGCGYKWKK